MKKRVMKKRPPLWKRLALPVVTGTAVAAVMRALMARRAPQRPAVPAPSKEWPPLPDLAATTASATTASPTPAPPPSPADEPVPAGAASPDPTETASPVSAVVVTPAVRSEAPRTSPEPPVASPPPADEVDAPADVTAAPVVRVPGDGPGGAVGTIVPEERPTSDERLEDGRGDAADEEHLVTDPEPEAVLPDERIDRAREEQPLLADADGGVPPAPEPTFGTVPDPEAAADAPVPVATPVETGPEEELPIPHRSDPVPPAPVVTEPAAAPKAKRGSSSAKAATSAKASQTAPVGTTAPVETTGDRAALTPWVVPNGGGCPGSHPVKAELSEGRFHVPGGAGYDSATADRCYLDAGAAEVDGLRPADG